MCISKKMRIYIRNTIVYLWMMCVCVCVCAWSSVFFCAWYTYCCFIVSSSENMSSASQRSASGEIISTAKGRAPRPMPCHLSSISSDQQWSKGWFPGKSTVHVFYQQISGCPGNFPIQFFGVPGHFRYLNWLHHRSRLPVLVTGCTRYYTDRPVLIWYAAHRLLK